MGKLLDRIRNPKTNIGKAIFKPKTKGVEIMAYSAGKSIAKGIEPVAAIGIVSTIVVAILSGMGIDIDEKTVAAIGAGATSFWGVVVSVRNWAKNRKR
jgi:hypothetical protein